MDSFKCYVAFVAKSPTTCVVQFRPRQELLAPASIFIGMWYGDVTPRAQFSRNLWRDTINHDFYTNFKRIRVDSKMET